MSSRLILILLFTAVVVCHCSYKTQAKTNHANAPQELYFIENKGQIKDQYHHPRKDIQYALQGQGITVFIGDGQLHYQFSHATLCTPDNFLNTKTVKKYNPGIQQSGSPHIETYRMDVEVIGANKSAAIITGEEQVYYEKYYLPGSLANGIQARTYKKITYKNILPEIDWVICIKDGKPEHEFVVRPGGDASNIKLRYKGQTKLAINEDGSLSATTPMGVIKEQAPVCYLSNNKTIPVSYQLQGNVLGYETKGNKQEFVIDPVLEWGTYYGPDTSSSPLYAVASDGAGNVYATGVTYAASTGNIATTGSYQSTYGGGEDAYLVKFDSSGNRLWATYYGGSGLDWGTSVTCDQSGNVYLGGFTSSVDSIATSGSHQPAFGGTTGSTNGFLAKFTSSGSRIWATYYGGDQTDEIHSVVCDYLNNIYISGSASSTFNIATPGSFEPFFINPAGQKNAGFLVKFDSAGVRLWGTYYKGFIGTSSSDVNNVHCCTDGSHEYIFACTMATDSITTPGCWQPSLHGNSDDFVAKFDNMGNRMWATYFGGENEETGGSLVSVDGGGLYLLGGTLSNTGIASAGCYQPVRGGGMDAFLAKFDDLTGMRDWSTYYGGPGDEDVASSQICVGAGGVYIIGGTSSTTGIASTSAWQTTYGGGGDDAFLAEYDPSGVQQWSTYYGGSGNEEAYGCGFDGVNIYICGITTSPDQIATPGSFDTSYDGNPSYNKGFLAKFANLYPGPILGEDTLCFGSATTLSNSIAGGIWSSGNTAVAVVNAATGIVTGVSAGTVIITYYVPGGNYVTFADTIKVCPEKVSTIEGDGEPLMFPNPATKQIIITSAVKINNVTICNLLGQTVYDHVYNSDLVQIEIADLPAGTYFVKINFDPSNYLPDFNPKNLSITKRFVKE